MDQEVQTNQDQDQEQVYQAPELKLLAPITTVTRGPSGGTIDGLAGAPGGFITPS